MTGTVNQVRRIRRIRDVDGGAVDVGVDYDTVTISGTVRLNRQQRRAFVKALAEATEAVAAYERAHAEDTWAAMDKAAFPMVPPGQIDAEVAADVHRLTRPAGQRPHPHIAPFETGEPWRGPAQIEWDASR